MEKTLLTLAVCFFLTTTSTTRAATRPHIVLIISDDQGWRDVGYRDPDMATPNLDRLVSEGVELNQSYVQPLCSPSRAALLSGVYPFKLGMQDSVLTDSYNNSLPLGLTLLPEKLRDLGYATHLVGKWHLGFCSWSMTPTFRGFDSFYGMYLGKGGYFDHRGSSRGYDLHFNDTLLWNEEGIYSTHLFTQRAVDIVTSHPPDEPLFLVLSYQAVHSPLEVPVSYETDYCDHIRDPDRRKYCAMTAAMDEGIGNVTAALEQAGLDENLLLMFTSDNGGQPTLGASNWPLRGGKSTLWEGGTRALSLLHSKTLLPTPFVWNGLIHAVDWFPTLLSVAGDDTENDGIDGINQWSAIRSNGDSLREDMVYNINEVKDNAAIRFGRYKLVYNKPGNPDGWYNPPEGVTAPPEPSNKSPTFQLFDLTLDPTETTNILNTNSTTRQIGRDLKAKLAAWETQLVPSQTGVHVPAAEPTKAFRAWYPGWC